MNFMSIGYDNWEINTMTLVKCKKHNRYQREQYWESKPFNRLLDAIQKGYVPVGKDIYKLDRKVKR